VDGETAADDSLNTGATTRAVNPLSLRVHGRLVAAADALMACHGSRPKYRCWAAFVSAAGSGAVVVAGAVVVGGAGSAPVAGGTGSVPETGTPSVKP
jgi:hypothetical protein